MAYSVVGGGVISLVFGVYGMTFEGKLRKLRDKFRIRLVKGKSHASPLPNIELQGIYSSNKPTQVKTRTVLYPLQVGLKGLFKNFSKLNGIFGCQRVLNIYYIGVM